MYISLHVQRTQALYFAFPRSFQPTPCTVHLHHRTRTLLTIFIITPHRLKILTLNLSYPINFTSPLITSTPYQHLHHHPYHRYPPPSRPQNPTTSPTTIIKVLHPRPHIFGHDSTTPPNLELSYHTPTSLHYRTLFAHLRYPAVVPPTFIIINCTVTHTPRILANDSSPSTRRDEPRAHHHTSSRHITRALTRPCESGRGSGTFDDQMLTTAIKPPHLIMDIPHPRATSTFLLFGEFAVGLALFWSFFPTKLQPRKRTPYCYPRPRRQPRAFNPGPLIADKLNAVGPKNLAGQLTTKPTGAFALSVRQVSLPSSSHLLCV